MDKTAELFAMNRYFYISLPHATFAIGANKQSEVIHVAPPIARWMIGKTLQEIKPWLISKKAKVRELREE